MPFNSQCLHCYTYDKIAEERAAEHAPALSFHTQSVTSRSSRLKLLGSRAEAFLQLQAGDNLVVLEVESTEVCQTGLDEVEHHWKEDKEAALNPCKKLKHVLQRTARDSPDVRFVTLEVVH